MWQHDVAKIVRVNRSGVSVQCPHCPKRHTHSKLSLGSGEVIAGCHAGYTRCRSYSIPERVNA